MGDLAGDPRFPFRLYVPPELEAGTYANTAVVRHTMSEFTLDFAVVHAPEPSDMEDPESSLVSTAHVVARVHIPPTLVFGLLQAVNMNMTKYESAWGEIVRPRPRREEGSNE